MAALRGLPADGDGHVSDMGGPVLCIGAARHRLVAEPPSTAPGP